MAEVIKFIRREVWTVFLTVFAVAAWVYGALSAAEQVWSWGIPEWGWQSIGAVLFALGVLIFLYRHQRQGAQPAQTPSDAPTGAPDEGEKSDPDWLGKLELIQGKQFFNCDVLLDNKNYVACTFTNVTLVYDGGPVNLTNIDFHGNIIIRPTTQNCLRLLAIMTSLGFMNHIVIENDKVSTAKQLRERQNIRLGIDNPDQDSPSK